MEKALTFREKRNEYTLKTSTTDKKCKAKLTFSSFCFEVFPKILTFAKVI